VTAGVTQTPVSGAAAAPIPDFAGRLAKTQAVASDAGLAAFLVAVGPDLRYLAGYNAMPLERLTLLIVPASGRSTLLAPRLEGTPARSSPAAAGGHVDVATWEETEDPSRVIAEIVRGSGGEQDAGPRIAVSDRLWAMHLLRFQSALPGHRFESAAPVMRQLRIIKDAAEIDLLRQAAETTDRVLQAVMHGPLVGRTEADVSREIRDRLIAAGHDVAEFAIVGSGPNSASPHHEAGARLIAAGEPVLFDVGGRWAGYCSDTTRMVWVTGGDPNNGPDEEFTRIYEAVRDAQDEAAASARPGMPAERVDAVARGIITGAGYGERFIHRTGHGIGLEEHEDPYLVSGNAEPLRAGMAFSIEPGIYLDGRYGVRIEDILVATESGAVALNRASRELLVVDGR
jgi:Xaa-Pro aminopeptidase